MKPTYSFVAYEAEDLKGVWIAHCLNLDVVTQGDSLHEALSMVCEAVELVVQEPGFTADAYKKAPEKEWTKMTRVFERGKEVDLTKLVVRKDLANRTVAGFLIVHEDKTITIDRDGCATGGICKC